MFSLTVQWELNDGNCGLCGDSYTDSHPQPNENTGQYGQGIIAKTYNAGAVINVEVLLTKNHLGSFQFSLCELKDVNAPEPNEECFETLSLADGSTQLPIFAGQTNFNVAVQLPLNKTCDRCVLRWHYRSGNNWGDCGDGSYGMGCGVQETFRTCSDVTIV